MLKKVAYSDSSVEDPSWSGEGTLSEEETLNSDATDSDLSKLKHLCLSFFSTLSTLEIEHLNISKATPTVDTSVNTSPESLVRELDREGVNDVLVGSMFLDVPDQSKTTPRDCTKFLGILP